MVVATGDQNLRWWGVRCTKGRSARVLPAEMEVSGPSALASSCAPELKPPGT